MKRKSPNATKIEAIEKDLAKAFAALMKKHKLVDTFYDRGGANYGRAGSHYGIHMSITTEIKDLEDRSDEDGAKSREYVLFLRSRYTTQELALRRELRRIK